MTQQGQASRLLSALVLLLLGVPGSLSLRGPSTVTGTVGGSLRVQCRYEEEYTEHRKYWCKSPCFPLMEIVTTTEPEREVRRGRVSIRDHPANLTFTVTLDSLTEDDGDTYGCGIDIAWGRDIIFQVEVSVVPALTSVSPTTITGAETSTISAQMPTVSTAWHEVKATHSENSQEELPQDPGQGLHVLLSLLVLLLLLLGGTSLLAWRMFQRRTKGYFDQAGEKLKPLQNPHQAAEQEDVCYANLELQTWPLQREPLQPGQVEVEYSTVGPCKDDVHYSSVVFSFQGQDSEDKIPSQRAQQKETEYSVVRT